MVIIMESRYDRYKKNRRQGFFNFLKGTFIILMFIVFIYFIVEVNQTIINLNVLDNTTLLKLDIKDGSISILGDTYKFNSD